MNTGLFIARRISRKDKDNFAAPIVKLAIVAVALGMAVMIISMAVLSGFQKEIRKKVIGFASHIQLHHFDSNASYETAPMELNTKSFQSLEKIEGVRHIQAFAIKAGIIKTEAQIQGVVVKGVSTDFDWEFFKENLVSGTIFDIPDTGSTDKILISNYIARRLRIKPGDETRMYFVSGGQSQPRARRFLVSGIYETGLEEFDKVYVIADIRHIQRLNNWRDDQVSGFEIFIDDFKRLDEISEKIYGETGYDLNAETVKDAYPQVFDWLKLMDMNVIIIMILMIAVSIITMVSTLLILILDRTNMIGTLKALGMKNIEIRRIFIYNAIKIIGLGILWGNITGLLICLLQYYFKIIPLDQESYYISYVPVNIDLLSLLLINVGTLIICFSMLILPSYIITRISPIRAIRFS